MKDIFLAAIAVATVIGGIAFDISKLHRKETENIKQVENSPTPPEIHKIKMIKDVGEAYMDDFGLTDEDFRKIKEAGFNLIEGNFDICASDGDVNYFLDGAKRHGLKVIMPAGSGEAEWGYECGQEKFPISQQPVWQKDQVQSWIKKWKSHPEIYGWDISNEAGSVFPNARILNDENGSVPDIFYIDKNQLKLAYKDVKASDSSRPAMIRMNGWFFYDEVNGQDPTSNDFFRAGNPFDKSVADIVMINAYSNVSDYYSDFVPTVTKRAINSIKEIDPDVQILISLGAWEEKPLWYLPKIENLRKEIDYLNNMNILGIAYFKYGAAGSEWYLPDSASGAPAIWEVVKK